MPAREPGAESIQPWPLDEGMQRILAIVVTGVTTGIIIRLILFGLGFQEGPVA